MYNHVLLRVNVLVSQSPINRQSCRVVAFLRLLRLLDGEATSTQRHWHCCGCLAPPRISWIGGAARIAVLSSTLLDLLREIFLTVSSWPPGISPTAQRTLSTILVPSQRYLGLLTLNSTRFPVSCGHSWKIIQFLDNPRMTCMESSFLSICGSHISKGLDGCCCRCYCCLAFLQSRDRWSALHCHSKGDFHRSTVWDIATWRPLIETWDRSNDSMEPLCHFGLIPMLSGFAHLKLNPFHS